MRANNKLDPHNNIMTLNKGIKPRLHGWGGGGGARALTTVPSLLPKHLRLVNFYDYHVGMCINLEMVQTSVHSGKTVFNTFHNL